MRLSTAATVQFTTYCGAKCNSLVMKIFLCSLVALFLISGTQTWKFGPLSDDSMSYDSLSGFESSEEIDISGSNSGPPKDVNEPVDVYCSLPCGKQHVGCKDNKLQAEPNCPDSSVEDLSEYIDLIVDFHNDIRNKVAGGHIGNLKPATRMGTMIWDDELQETAEMQAKLCISGPLSCHGTKEFKYSGQNSGRYTYSGDLQRFNMYQIIYSQLEHWQNSSSFVTPNIIKRFYPKKWGPAKENDIGVFTMIVREENTHIGCSLKRYEILHGAIKVILICNYATNNFVKAPVYKTGDPASECKTGPNPLYENLCSLNEKYYYP